MSEKLVKVCDICYSETEPIKTFYVTKGGSFSDDRFDLGDADKKTVEVCNKCITNAVRLDLELRKII